MTDLICVDFHNHTYYSPDSLTKIEDLIRVSKRRGIDKLIITDHNLIVGALEAQQIAPDYVIVGEEIMTNQGEILAAFVKEVVPPFLSPAETIERLREQDAFISVSHPFDKLRSGGWRLDDLLAIADKVDAIETFNARCFFPWYNWQAESFARDHDLPGTHGSDAHAPGEVGAGTILLPPFEDAESLRAVIRQAQSPALRLLMPWVHLNSTYAKWVKR